MFSINLQEQYLKALGDLDVLPWSECNRMLLDAIDAIDAIDAAKAKARQPAPEQE